MRYLFNIIFCMLFLAACAKDPGDADWNALFSNYDADDWHFYNEEYSEDEDNGEAEKEYEDSVISAIDDTDDGNIKDEYDADTLSSSWIKVDQLEWSEKSEKEINWNSAKTYCLSRNARLPSISELRTLVINCSNNQIGGSCAVTDSCLNSTCYSIQYCQSCGKPQGTVFSLLGDTDAALWSSSSKTDITTEAWTVLFFYGYVDSSAKLNNRSVRCVRTPE